MKRWLLTFSAVLAAGLITACVWNGAAERRDQHNRAVLLWQQRASELRIELDRSPSAPLCALAKLHLTQAPKDANGTDLETALFVANVQIGM